MIVLYHTEKKFIGHGLGHFDTTIDVQGEGLDEAMAMLLAGLELVVNKFIESHPEDCKECAGFKQAVAAHYYMTQFNEEMKTMFGAEFTKGDSNEKSQFG